MGNTRRDKTEAELEAASSRESAATEDSPSVDPAPRETAAVVALLNAVPVGKDALSNGCAVHAERSPTHAARQSLASG